MTKYDMRATVAVDGLFRALRKVKRCAAPQPGFYSPARARRPAGGTALQHTAENVHQHVPERRLWSAAATPPPSVILSKAKDLKVRPKGFASILSGDPSPSTSSGWQSDCRRDAGSPSPVNH